MASVVRQDARRGQVSCERQGGPMRTRAATAAAGLAAAALLLTACHPDGVAAKGPSAAPRKVPDLVGKGLQTAQDAAEAAGFHRLTSHDSAGRARHQLL